MISFILLGKLWVHIEFNLRYYRWFAKGTGYVSGKPYTSHVIFGIPKVVFVQLMYFHHNDCPSKYFRFIKRQKSKV